jgi:hypothetical protein
MRVNIEAKYRHHLQYMRLAWREALACYDYGWTADLQIALAEFRYHEANTIGFASI